MKRALEVDAGAAGARVDVFLGERLGLSRARLKALFDEGAVRVDGKRARKGVALCAGQRVEVEVPDATAAAVPDAALALAVLWEDESLVFVDKAAGVPSQPLRPGETGTVANALLARYPDMAGAGQDEREAGLCHRLDVETSGVLLAARTRAVWEAVRAAFGREGAVDKRYLALVAGGLADEGEIDLPLAHRGDHVRPALDGEDGRPARSSFEVQARAGSAALVRVRLHTGVLHQVRAHLAAVGAPIVGDTAYGGPADEGGRFFLHAQSLELEHPVTKRRLRVEAPAPDALRAAAARLGLALP